MFARMWIKGNPPTLLVGMQDGAATLENSMEALKKLKIELPYIPAILALFKSDGWVSNRQSVGR